MRINELARKYDLSNKDIIDYLTRIGVTGKSHSSALDDDLVEKVLTHFKIKDEDGEEAKPQSKFKRIKRVQPLQKPKEVEKPKTPPLPVAATAKPEIVDFPPVRAEVKPFDVAAEAKSIGVEVAHAQVPETISVVESEIESPIGIESGETIRMTPSGPVVVIAGQAQDVELFLEETFEPLAVEVEEEEELVQPAVAHQGPSVVPEEKVIEPERDGGKKSRPGGKRESRRDSEKQDTDEALRREIQKLKKKRMRTAPVEPPQPAPALGAGRPIPGQTPLRPAPPRGRGRDGGRGKRAWRREKRERIDREIAAEREREIRDKTAIKVHDATTVADVASNLGIPPNELIAKLIGFGIMATVNQRLEHDAIELIAAEYGFQVEKVDMLDEGLLSSLIPENILEEDLQTRSPIVTIMGHVDHGKTKLLDRIRKSDVVSGEAGGITQHIGAYQVTVDRGTITFLDTPGHAAFTAMRARGAMVTDIVILVVAADDSVMPQTIEAINHAKAAGVPIIIAINKIDRPAANLDRVKQDLASNGLLVEDWGGDIQCYPISALQGIGVDELLEGILLQAEMLDLKASPKCKARGTIVEARREEGRGAVATVLIQQGTLRIGDPFVSGLYCGRIRSMTNDRGISIQVAPPATPVEISGLQDVPTAGDPFAVVEDDAQARQIAIKLQQAQRQRDLKKGQRVTLDQLHGLIESGDLKELHLIVKADVQGSVEAVVDSLLNIESEKVKVTILHSGVGAVSDSDVMLASASNAMIVGFNVQVQPSASMLAKQESVEILTFNIIYQAIDAIRNAMAGLLDRAFRENVLGWCEVREIFRLSKGLSIAGCQVKDGKIARNRPIRVVRDSNIVHKGKLSSLKRFKDDVSEVLHGLDCGIGIESFNDLQVGDSIECYELEEVTPTL